MNALEAALAIANRLKDPQQAANPHHLRLDPWNPLSLGKGYPGIVLLLAELDQHFPDAGWDVIAHQYLLEIQKELETKGIPDLSLFSGLAGIAFAVRMASRGGTRYGSLLKKLEQVLVDNLRTPRPFELIQGQVGIGAYLLIAEHPAVEGLLNDLVKSLGNPHQINGHEVPGWFRLEPRTIEHYPKGYFDCGMAHGMTGAIAFLAIALKSGYEVPRQREILQLMLDWLLGWKQTDEWGTYWPEKISFEAVYEHAQLTARPRAAWCYGNGGISRALGLASVALNDQKLGIIADQAIDSAFERPEWDLLSPTLCHGYAGLLHVTTRSPHRERLIQRILQDFKPQVAFGIRHFTQQKPEGFDHSGFLDGAAGVAFELLAVAKDRKLPWDRALLLN